MDSELLKQYITGTVGSMQLTEGFLLGAGILMEISIAMVLLSRILNHKANRLANIIAGTLKTLVMIATMFVGKSSRYYLFFGTIEMACTTFIVWYAWTWKKPGQGAGQAQL